MQIKFAKGLISWWDEALRTMSARAHWTLILLLIFAVPSSWAVSEGDCSDMEVWDLTLEMCMPLPMSGMPMRMVMVHGNAFAVAMSESGPRGRSGLAAPNMWMADVGTSLGQRQYLNLDYMGTVERWTFPERGYPELLQIGESNSRGEPFLDAQHPHSSPAMGLTFSDTIRLNEEARDFVKLYFAPRGESTDGPIAYMHRTTGIINPDAPLGHHVGQDSGHISSTVAGAMLAMGRTRFETSVFNGREPSPEAVDMPMGPINSFAARISEEWNSHFTVMASFAHVENPEANEPDVAALDRYSASLYTSRSLVKGWTLHNTLIGGLITHLDRASTLGSLTEEFLFSRESSRWWGRAEALQRTPAELGVAQALNLNTGRWVEALTLGLTRVIGRMEEFEWAAGLAVTVDFLPSAYAPAYGSSLPVSGKVFLQLGGMKMANF